MKNCLRLFTNAQAQVIKNNHPLYLLYCLKIDFIWTMFIKINERANFKSFQCLFLFFLLNVIKKSNYAAKFFLNNVQLLMGSAKC